MSRRQFLLIVGLIAVFIALSAALMTYWSFHSRPDATAQQTGLNRASDTSAPPPGDEDMPKPSVSDSVKRSPFLGLPEDYGLTPQEFHQIRLKTLTLGRTEAKAGGTTLPGFKYVTLDRPVDLDYHAVMMAGVELYKEVIGQKILTAAPMFIMLRNLDPRNCTRNLHMFWEPALPVLPDVTKVSPPLVLKEQPQATVVVDPGLSMRFDFMKRCKDFTKQTDGVSGDILFRMKEHIPLTGKNSPKVPLADFILLPK